MLKLVARRLALGVVTLWVVSILIFVGTEILPGDVATAILGQSRTPETVAAVRASLGLNRPAPVRYAEWLIHFAEGDIGKSLANDRDIAPEIRVRLGHTRSFLPPQPPPSRCRSPSCSASWRSARIRSSTASYRSRRFRRFSLPEFFTAIC